MRILIVGAGVIGSVYGAKLLGSGHARAALRKKTRRPAIIVDAHGSRGLPQSPLTITSAGVSAWERHTPAVLLM